MKLEIDFSKPEDLLETERQLEMALATVKSAIAEIRRNGTDLTGLPTAPVNNAAPNDVSKTTVSSLVVSMPSEFTMRQIFERADAAGVARPKARKELGSMVTQGTLLLIEKGQGQRPSRFRKA